MSPTRGLSSTSAVICVRVSPRPAENVRYSPEIQEQKCREWCDAHGIPVVRVIQDILVSGADPKRFTPILQSLTDDRPTHFVVSDISRFTRDHPKRYWAVIGLIEDAGAQVVSVDQPYLGSDIPFGATIATAQVEANYLQRIESNKKTSAAVRAAIASGKHVGRIWGWTFDGEWHHDDALINGFYDDLISGYTFWEMGQKYGMRPSHVPVHARAVSQREVVGVEKWLRAQASLVRRPRSQRRGARQSNIFRGLLICPWCGDKLQHRSNAWGNYICNRIELHGWRSVSAPLHVVPRVQEVLSLLVLPDSEAEALQKANQPPDVPAVDPEEVREEIERLGLLWAGKRLSDKTYEERVTRLEALLSEPEVVPPPPEEQIEVLRDLGVVDLLDQDPESGDLTNILLHQVLEPIVLEQDRSVAVVTVKRDYRHWLLA